MSLLNPTPHTALSHKVDSGEGDTEVCCDGSQNLTGCTSGSDRSDLIDSEFVSGSSGSEVAHVLAVVPEVKVSKIDAPKVAVVAGVQNVGVSGVAVVEKPHSAGRGNVPTLDGHGAASFSSKRRLTFISDRQRRLTKNISEGISAHLLGRAGMPKPFHALVMHGAVAVSAVLAFALLNLTRFHNQNYTASLGV